MSPDAPRPLSWSALTGAAILLGLCALPLSAQTEPAAPLSAIDWLSQSVATPAKMLPQEPATSRGASPEDVAVSTLDGPQPDGVGTLPGSVTGLPADLWGLGRTEEIAARITAEQTGSLPALQGLFLTLLSAEARAPADAEGRGVLLLARIDKLLDLGALDQAQALIDKAGMDTPDFFRRSFDVALLTGTEDRACVTMKANPSLAPTFPARIFCLARSGDWNAAALTLRTGLALGYVSPAEDDLLSRFLDPALFEGEPPLPVPDRPTPLIWRMMEAIGEPLPTQTLPVAFAHAELRDAAGWKAQLEAAERLARVGAIPPAALHALYTERRAAASGGVWDRVRTVAQLEAALAERPDEVARRLAEAWAAMVGAELEVPFAQIFAPRLAGLELGPEASALVFRIGLLAPRYEQVALARRPADPAEAFLIGLARGSLVGTVPQGRLGRAVAAAFAAGPPAPDAAALLEEGRLGEAILWAIDRIARGAEGDLGGVTEGLALLRHIGLESTARRTALELMLLERRG